MYISIIVLNIFRLVVTTPRAESLGLNPLPESTPQDESPTLAESTPRNESQTLAESNPRNESPPLPESNPWSDSSLLVGVNTNPNQLSSVSAGLSQRYESRIQGISDITKVHT